MHDNHSTILIIFARFECFLFLLHTNSTILIFAQQNCDFFSKIMQSARSTSIKTWFNHCMCFNSFLRMSNAICSWFVEIFLNFFISTSFKNDIVFLFIWLIKILNIILQNCVTELIVFWKKIVIRINSIEIWNLIKFRKISIKKNWSYFENKFIRKIIIQSTNCFEKSFIEKKNLRFESWFYSFSTLRW